MAAPSKFKMPNNRCAAINRSAKSPIKKGDVIMAIENIAYAFPTSTPVADN